MNRLAQFLYIILIGVLVFIVQVYSGPMLSKPTRTTMVYVKPALTNVVKKSRKPKKVRRRKLSKREKMQLAQRLLDNDGEPDWDLCDIKKV